MSITSTTSLSVQDQFTSTTAATFSAGDTTLYLNALPTPSEGFLALFTGTTVTEIVYYTSKGSNFVTIPSAVTGSGRGMYGTPTAFSSGTTVKMVVGADYWKELQNGNALGTGAVKGSNLSTSAIKLGYASATGVTVTTVATDLVSVTVTVPAGGRDIKITAQTIAHTGSGAGDDATTYAIKESSTTLGNTRRIRNYATVDNAGQTLVARVSAPSAGSHTYKLVATNDTRNSVVTGSDIFVENW